MCATWEQGTGLSPDLISPLTCHRPERSQLSRVQASSRGVLGGPQSDLVLPYLLLYPLP